MDLSLVRTSLDWDSNTGFTEADFDRYRCRYVTRLEQTCKMIHKHSAAFLGHFDFIYCVPEAYLSVPFTFLGQLFRYRYVVC